MKTVTVIFEESLHHVCLMHGLKQTYGRMPFLNKRVLEIRGRVMTIDNVVTPPPMMNNPSRRTGMRGTRNMVGVSYWKNKLFMKTIIKDGICYEQASGHLIAEIK